MELYNKYLPKKVEDYYLHPKLQEFLGTINIDDIPNIIIHGEEGSGKRSFLNVLFPEKKTKIVKSIKYNSKEIDYTIYKSKHTLEIDSKELRIYNNTLLQRVIKELSETKNVNNNTMKIIIIHNAEYLDNDFQYILRKIIELYSFSAKFILVTSTLSKIINPIISRCLGIRVANPTKEKIREFITMVNKNEKLGVNENKITRIVNSCDRNLKRAILDLEMYTYESKLNLDSKINMEIKKIVSSLRNKNFNIKLVENWETKLYNLIINFSINDNRILHLLFFEILNLCKNNKDKKRILEITTMFDERMTKGSKSIIHLNNYLVRIFKELKDMD